MPILNVVSFVGLPETVWAAAVPMNYDRKLEELVEDIYGDHVYLVSQLLKGRSKKTITVMHGLVGFHVSHWYQYSSYGNCKGGVKCCV